MPRKNRQRRQVPLDLGVPPIHSHALTHNYSDGTPINRQDIQAAWWQRIYVCPPDPDYPAGHRILACRANGVLLEIGVANYGTASQQIIHADLLREKFKQLMDRDMPGWRARWES
jgi:hypothetical protein